MEIKKGKSERKLSKADFQAQAEFRYALRQFLRFSEETTRSVGMTTQKYQALLAIKGFPDREFLTIGELAERLQVKHHSAVGLVDRLVQKGLVQRTPGDKDRRQVYVHLTKQGEDLIEQLVLAHRKELNVLWPSLKMPVQGSSTDDDA
jgi:DNA-binding MarR family transcriptional regulator